MIQDMHDLCTGYRADTASPKATPTAVSFAFIVRGIGPLSYEVLYSRVRAAPVRPHYVRSHASNVDDQRRRLLPFLVCLRFVPF